MMKPHNLMVICVVLPCLVPLLGCGAEASEEDDSGMFRVFLDQGDVIILSHRDSLECRYYSPTMCEREQQSARFRVNTKSHLERVYEIGSLDAKIEYNKFDSPGVDICHLPPGSIYLELFMYPPPPNPPSSGASEPTLIEDDDTPVINHEFIRLSPRAMRHSPYAREAREFMYWAMEECEKKGALTGARLNQIAQTTLTWGLSICPSLG